MDKSEVRYTYDSLGRLSSAQTTGPAWGYSYSYDGFGNLLAKNVTKGNPSAGWSGGADPATNRGWGSFDANGNLVFSLQHCCPKQDKVVTSVIESEGLGDLESGLSD